MSHYVGQISDLHSCLFSLDICSLYWQLSSQLQPHKQINPVLRLTATQKTRTHISKYTCGSIHISNSMKIKSNEIKLKNLIRYTRQQRPQPQWLKHQTLINQTNKVMVKIWSPALYTLTSGSVLVRVIRGMVDSSASNRSKPRDKGDPAYDMWHAQVSDCHSYSTFTLHSFLLSALIALISCVIPLMKVLDFTSS